MFKTKKDLIGWLMLGIRKCRMVHGSCPAPIIYPMANILSLTIH